MSYQCSPLSTPEGIVGIFKQCAKLQEGKDLNNFVSIVVLDEIGLAEDSPKMPLKVREKIFLNVLNFYRLKSNYNSFS